MGASRFCSFYRGGFLHLAWDIWRPLLRLESSLWSSLDFSEGFLSHRNFVCLIAISGVDLATNSGLLTWRVSKLDWFLHEPHPNAAPRMLNLFTSRSWIYWRILICYECSFECCLYSPVISRLFVIWAIFVKGDDFFSAGLTRKTSTFFLHKIIK